MPKLSLPIALFLFSTQQAGAVDVYFSPGNACEDHLMEAISTAQREIHAVVYTINSPRIVHALITATLRGVDVEILTDRNQADAPGSRVDDLMNGGVGVRLHKKGRLEHNAFGVFDGKLAMNGSYNWTEGASVNSENCAMMPEPEAVAAFERRFNELWGTSGIAVSKR